MTVTKNIQIELFVAHTRFLQKTKKGRFHRIIGFCKKTSVCQNVCHDKHFCLSESGNCRVAGLFLPISLPH